MTRSDLLWKIEHGDDIMFDVAGRHFTIFTWPDEGIRVVEQNTGDPGVFFKTPADVVDQFTVDATPLSQLIGDIIITSYTQCR